MSRGSVFENMGTGFSIPVPDILQESKISADQLK